MWTPPKNESTELTRGAGSLVNSLLWGKKIWPKLWTQACRTRSQPWVRTLTTNQRSRRRHPSPSPVRSALYSSSQRPSSTRSRPRYEYVHCNENPTYVFLSGNSAASAPISTCMFLCAIYIVPGSVYMQYFFPQNRQTDRGTINHSQMHECGNWDWDPDIPYLGIFV